MTRLRLTRKREKDVGHDADLRGFGAYPVFQKSGFFVVLHVRDVPPNEDKLNKILESYQLKITENKSYYPIQITTQSQGNGEHKVQAIKLFFAALEIFQEFPESKMHLAQHSHLQGHVEGDPEWVVPSKLYQHDDAQTSLSMESCFTLYLNQAGIDVDNSEEPLELTRSSLVEFIESVLRPASNGAGKRTARSGSKGGPA